MSFLFIKRVLQVSIGLFFVTSGSLHLGNQFNFMEAVGNYRIVSGSMAVVLAEVLPFLQITCGVSLVCGLFARGGNILTLLMCIAFCLAQISVLSRGLNVDCGCFGSYSKNVGAQSLAIAMMLTLSTAICLEDSSGRPILRFVSRR